MKLDDKTVVKEYFNSSGFERWQRIYGDGEVNKVQRDIRTGHQKTIDTVLAWLETEDLANMSICDAGCGVGSLSIPLAAKGAQVFGSDISEKMVTEAKNRAKTTLGDSPNLSLEVSDLEAISGKYHTVICLDVLIHYPDTDMENMISHLASLAESRLILSFAPKTCLLTILKKIGEFFPGPSKTTRAYQHRETNMINILKANGLTLKRSGMTSTRFYYSRILEVTRD